MKNKTMLRFLLCFLIIGIFVGACCTYAAGPDATNFFKAGEKIDGWAGMSTVNGVKDAKKIIDNTDELTSPITHIQSFIMMLGIFCAVAVVAIYAVQWMVATPSKVQELKAGMWPVAIGVALLSIGPAMTVKLYNAILSDKTTATAYVENAGGKIIGTIQTVGYAVGAVMIFVVAVQWFTAATPNKRQELKGRLWNILVGAFLLIGGVTILGMIYNLAK